MTEKMNHKPARLGVLLLVGLLFFCGTSASRAQVDVLQLEELALKSAVAKVAPSVVRIETFGGLEKVGGVLVGTGPTTGLAVSHDGYVVSSAFNFVQQPSSILVTLPNGKRASAEIVARDQSRMLVLLKVTADYEFVVPEAVPRDEMVVGQWSIAVGRTFAADQPNMSVGVLSATTRIWGRAIQTDAKISPSNYGGPLVDIFGRVLGILVPLSPQSTGEVAGAEWYDSGIGFAVPLDELNQTLPRLKKGEDLHSGILGVSLKGRDIYADEVVIAAVPPKSPAADAGLKPDDKIIELDGIPIERQAQLKHALGPRYAGEEIQVAVLRGEDRIERTITLTDELVPYEHPFLGVLPGREPREEPGFMVRFVYPGSPADEAGIRVGDEIIKLQDREVASAHEMRQFVATHIPGDTIQLTIRRDDQLREIEAQMARLPVDILDELTPSVWRPSTDDIQRPDVGVIEVRIPEEKNECMAYVPEAYHPSVIHGLVVWLHAPGKFDQEELLSRWKQHCDDRGFILLAPKSADPRRWNPAELPFIRKTINDITNTYSIDPARIVVHGYQAGGTMAYLVALGQRDLVRGVAAVDAAPPRRGPAPTNEPVQRLAIYTTATKNTRLAAAIQAGIERFKEARFPVTIRDIGSDSRNLNANEIAELARWIDALDRI